jgi:glycosyltransferase involved in cell wall biosynthesis
VLLPFRDAARTLPSALSSIRRQTLRELEIVAVDDGSRDEGPELVARAARADPRILLCRQPASGLPAALNAGAGLCRAELVARMDADDVAARERLALQCAFLDAHPEVAVVGSRIRIAPRRLVSDGMDRYQRWLNSLLDPASHRRELFVESPLCHPSTTIRRSVLEAVGGYRADGAWAEDYDLWMRIDEAGGALAKLDRCLLLWRERPGRLTRTAPAYARERFLPLKLHHLKRRLRGRTVLVWGAGQEGKPWLRALGGERLLEARVVDVDPRKLGQWIHGCRVIPPGGLGPPATERLVLVAVGAEGARQEIRAYLAERGYREPEDFVCVA